MLSIGTPIREYAFLWGAATYLLLSTYSPGRHDVYSVHAFFMLALYCSVLFIRIAMTDRHIVNVRFGLCTLYIFALALLLASGVSYNAAFLGAVNNFIYQLFFIALLILFASKTRWDAYRLAIMFAQIMLVFAVISAIGAYQLYFTGGVLLGPLYFRDNTWPQLYGWFQSPNFFINAISIGAISLVFLRGARKTSVNGFYILLLLLLITALLSGSKGGILALILSYLISYLIYLTFIPSSVAIVNSFKLLSKILLVCLVLGALTVAYLNYIGVGTYWLTNSIIRIQSISTGTGRIGLWQNTLALIESSGVFELLFGRGNNYIINSTGVSTHNAHLKILVEYGLVCYLIITTVFLGVIYRALKLANCYSVHLTLYLIALMLYAWIRSFFNSGLFSMGLTGLSFIVCVFLVSFRTHSPDENIVFVEQSA